MEQENTARRGANALRAALYARCREAVSARDAAERYGLPVGRGGRALCPYHDDHHPSMSFRDGRFRCWSCGESGDCVDLTAKLLGLDAPGALRRLNEDFSLGLPIGAAPDAEALASAKKAGALRELEGKYDAWREETLLLLCKAIREGNLALRTGREPTEAEALALRWRDALEYWCELLERGSMEEQMEVFRERKGVRRTCERILNASRTSSAKD